MSLSMLLLLPCMIGLLLIIGAWTLQTVWQIRRERALEARRASTRIYECESCDWVYLDRRPVPALACPRCGVLNEARIR